MHVTSAPATEQSGSPWRLSLRTATAAPQVSQRRADEQIAWLRDYAQKRINPQLIDDRRCIPPHIALDFGTAGLFGPLIEEGHGGTALRLTDLFRVLEQLMAVDSGLAVWVGSSVFLGTRALAAYGTETLKDEWLPRLAEGRILGAYAQTEPGAGSDFSGLGARAVSAPESGFRLNGAKHWIGNGTWAGVSTVIARLDAPRAVSSVVALAVPTALAGVHLGAEHQTVGLRGMVQSRIEFRDVPVPQHHLLGEGYGRAVALDSMNLTRLAVAACAVGAMKRIVQFAHRYATRRSMSGIRLIDRARTLDALGTVIARARTAEAMVYGLAARLDNGEAVEIEPVIATKVLAGEWAQDAADTLVQLLGARGYDEANPAGRLHRDLRVFRIFEGPTEALEDFLARRALGRASGPRETVLAVCGPEIAHRVEEALAEAREHHGIAPPDARHHTLARALMWAFAAGAVQTGGLKSDLAVRYTAREFDAALSAVHRSADVASLPTPADVADAVRDYRERIADLEFSLPGICTAPDPLLRPQTQPLPPVGAESVRSAPLIPAQERIVTTAPASQHQEQPQQLAREVAVTPSMCGQTSLLAGRIGDWTWQTVSRQCGLDVMKATTPDGEPTYLSFYYIRLRGSAEMHPHGLRFGDRLTVRSQAFDFGNESVLTLHLLAPADGTRTAALGGVDPEEFYRAPRPEYLYAETFNRWIHRAHGESNIGLRRASPPGFDHDRLPTLPREHSPRPLTSAARKTSSFLTDRMAALRPLADLFTTDHRIDPVRDLNGVGLVYFASYFGIVDAALFEYWRSLGRTDRSFLRRCVVDQQMGYFGNADIDTTVSVTLRAYVDPAEPGPRSEIFDVSARDRATGRLLAVCAIRLLQE